MNQSTAHRIARQTGLAVREARVVGSQHGYQHLLIALAGGQRAFAKVANQEQASPAEIGAAFAAEASGLRWLAEADAVPVPEVLAVTETALVISMIPPMALLPILFIVFGLGELSKVVLIVIGAAILANGARGRVDQPHVGILQAFVEQIAHAAVDVLHRIEDIGHAQIAGRERHQLHQTHRALMRNRARIVIRFGSDDGLHQVSVHRMTPRCFFDNGIQLLGFRKRGGSTRMSGT